MKNNKDDVLPVPEKRKITKHDATRTISIPAHFFKTRILKPLTNAAELYADISLKKDENGLPIIEIRNFEREPSGGENEE